MLDLFRPVHGRRARWRVLAAIVTALALFALLAAASTHHHQSALDSSACAICDAADDIYPGHPPVPRSPLVLLLQPYRIGCTPCVTGEHGEPRMLPPGRGPPSHV